MSEPIENWAAIVHKGVRTKDRLELGNVVEVDSEKFIAIQGVVKEKEYSLPHSVVESFDGAEVRLNITHKEAENYLVKKRKRHHHASGLARDPILASYARLFLI